MNYETGYGSFTSISSPTNEILAFPTQKLEPVNLRKLGNTFALSPGLWEIEYSFLEVNQDNNNNNIVVNFLVNGKIYNTLTQTLISGIGANTWVTQTNSLSHSNNVTYISIATSSTTTAILTNLTINFIETSTNSRKCC